MIKDYEDQRNANNSLLKIIDSIGILSILIILPIIIGLQLIVYIFKIRRIYRNSTFDTKMKKIDRQSTQRNDSLLFEDQTPRFQHIESVDSIVSEPGVGVDEANQIGVGEVRRSYTGGHKLDKMKTKAFMIDKRNQSSILWETAEGVNFFTYDEWLNEKKKIKDLNCKQPQNLKRLSRFMV